MRLLSGSLSASCQDLLLSDVWISASVRLARVLDQQMARNLLMRELCGRSQCDVALHSRTWSLAVQHPRNNLVVLSQGCTTALLAYGKEFIWGSFAEQLIVFHLLELRSVIFLVGQVEIYHSNSSFWNIFISQILNSLQASNLYCIPRYLITILEGDNLSFFAQCIWKICKSFKTKFCMSWVYYSPVRYTEEV